MTSSQDIIVADMLNGRSVASLNIGQIKLRQISVFNWGSFDGLHSATIDPVGTLITGDNGAGKSTLIDGLMALLLPAGKASFNIAAAQGDRTDRSLLSYMRGSYGSEHDGVKTRVKSKREGGVVTGLNALYQKDDGSQITLACLFWIAQASNSLSDVKRLYVITKNNLPLKKLLDTFGKGDIRALKKRMKEDALVSYCDNNFTEYQEVYRRLLSMENRNAPALLSRALGLKKIDDLTHLIRELVLEPSHVKNDARKVVTEFDDLVAIHDQLVDAKAREEALNRLPNIYDILQKSEITLGDLIAERDALLVFIAEQCALLWSGRAEIIKQELEQLVIELDALIEQEKQASLHEEQCHEAYINAGGNRIEQVQEEIKKVKIMLEQTSVKASKYQKLTAELELDSSLNRFIFKKNLDTSIKKLNDLDAEKKQAQDKFSEQAIKLSVIEDKMLQLVKNIKEIEARPDSNIDPRYQRMRDEMVEILGINAEYCMFIGELVDVQGENKIWQGAIERALGGLPTTLLVPHENYYLVTKWLNQTHTGLHVRVQVVNDVSSNTEPANFKAEGYLRKLVWRKHRYREWLKYHLARFDLQCVSSTENLNKTPFSMTVEGLIQKEKGRFEKKDQYKVTDQRKWQLGFSNKSRLSILRQDVITQNEKVQQADSEKVLARENMDDVETRASYWEKISEFQWQDIDVPTWHERMQVLNDTLVELTTSNDVLAVAEKHWQQAKQAVALVRDNKVEKSNVHAVKQNDHERAKQTIISYRQTAIKGLSDEVRELLVKRIGVITDESLDTVGTIENKARQSINELYETTNKRKLRMTSEATGIMVSFRKEWDVLASEWGATIADIEDYIEHLLHLQKEGLPELVGRFKERLNNHTTQSIATIKQKIEAEKEDIIERIDIINQVLRRTEFRPGSHLKLGFKIENFPHVHDFNAQVNQVLHQATSDDHENRFFSLQKVVEILDRASAPATVNNMESLRLLDPRHQLSFHAEEIETHSNRVLDVLESSSGKSGGEKESFAGTIVAASLAYVLTPDGYDKPVYCTVFLDEAFSNTAEAVSRRVLRVFRELNIHVNLITPYKNLNLARESANALIIAERDQSNHESRLCEVTWEEIDRRYAQQKKAKLTDEVATLGISINE